MIQKLKFNNPNLTNYHSSSSLFHIYIRISNLKVQTADPNIEHHLHIELSLEIKFYIFLNFFAIFQTGTKFADLMISAPSETSDFVPI
jgi:hypothetical protein